jgi:hypothetical protein
MTGTTKCGWCITGHHDQCKDHIVYYGKTWICTCECPPKEET